MTKGVKKVRNKVNGLISALQEQDLVVQRLIADKLIGQLEEQLAAMKQNAQAQAHQRDHLRGQRFTPSLSHCGVLLGHLNPRPVGPK